MIPCWYLIDCQCQPLLLFHIYFKNILVFVGEQLANAPMSAATHLAVALVDFQLSQSKKTFPSVMRKIICQTDPCSFLSAINLGEIEFTLRLRFAKWKKRDTCSTCQFDIMNHLPWHVHLCMWGCALWSCLGMPGGCLALRASVTPVFLLFIIFPFKV